MVKVDLITGFLGSGKTTFIKKYATYLINQGYKVGIIENDFGAVNVDMMLLQDLQSDNCELEMVAGACDKDCHQRRFKTKLISMGMRQFDRILVEPSGIFDVDEFFDGIMTMNTATSFLGSYKTKVEIVNNHDGTYQLNYEVSNDSGWESATRLRVSHEHSYHDGIIPNCERGEGIGLGGTITEKWKCPETITIN